MQQLNGVWTSSRGAYSFTFINNHALFNLCVCIAWILKDERYVLWLPGEVCTDKRLPEVSPSWTELFGTTHMARCGPHQLHNNRLVHTHTHTASTLKHKHVWCICKSTDKQALFSSTCKYLCVVLTGGTVFTFSTQVEEISSLLKPAINNVGKRGEAESRNVRVPADMPKRRWVWRGEVYLTRCCSLLCKQGQLLIPLLQ